MPGGCTGAALFVHPRTVPWSILGDETLRHVQTKSEIVKLLSERGIHPRKRFGQHFLIDGNLMRKLAECAELDRDDVVLEVGAGTGGLTDLMVDRVETLIGVEIDRDLYALLTERFRGSDGVRLLYGDILAAKHRLMSEVDDEIRAYDVTLPGRFKLVANLPYQVATPLVMNLLVDYPSVRRLCFTVQAEVGDRITATAGCKAYGPLSITAQLLCRVDTVVRIGPGAFWPAPAVDSVMLCMEVVDSPFDDVRTVRGFVQFVRRAFAHRRKTLRSALSFGLTAEEVERLDGLFDLARRPEQVAVDEWLSMYRSI